MHSNELASLQVSPCWHRNGLFFLSFSYACHGPQLVSQETASSSAKCSQDKLPFSFVRGQHSTMCDIIWISLQGHRSVSVSRHFLLQAPQWPHSEWKRFSRDHCCWGRSKPDWRIVWSHTTWSDFQLYPSINFWCQLVASPATAASWMSIVAMVGWGYQEWTCMDSMLAYGHHDWPTRPAASHTQLAVWVSPY